MNKVKQKVLTYKKCYDHISTKESKKHLRKKVLALRSYNSVDQKEEEKKEDETGKQPWLESLENSRQNADL